MPTGFAVGVTKTRDLSKAGSGSVSICCHGSKACLHLKSGHRNIWRWVYLLASYWGIFLRFPLRKGNTFLADVQRSISKQWAGNHTGSESLVLRGCSLHEADLRALLSSRS